MFEKFYWVDLTGGVYYYGRSGGGIDELVAQVADALPDTIFFKTIETTDLDTHFPDETPQDLTYENIRRRAAYDPGYKAGLQAAAKVCRAHSHDKPDTPPCPPGMLGVYLEKLASGELP